MVVDAIASCVTSSKSCWNTFNQGKVCNKAEFFIVLSRVNNSGKGEYLTLNRPV